MSGTFEREVLEAALNKLFTNRTFSICTVDEIGALLGVNPSVHPNYKYLRALHCVEYSQMSAAIKSELQAKVLQCFKNDFFIPAKALATALLIEGTLTDLGEEDNYKFKRLR